MDYAKPITAGDAVREAVTGVRAKVRDLERQRDSLVAQIDALTTVAWDMETTADRFDKYQPPGPPEPVEDQQ